MFDDPGKDSQVTAGSTERESERPVTLGESHLALDDTTLSGKSRPLRHFEIVEMTETTADLIRREDLEDGCEGGENKELLPGLIPERSGIEQNRVDIGIRDPVARNGQH